MGDVYRVVDPADSVPDVVLVLPFEYQAPVAVELLGRPVQLPVHVGAVEHHPILVGVDALALQGVINVVPLQGADGRDRKQQWETRHLSGVNPHPTQSLNTLECRGENQELVSMELQRQKTTYSTLSSVCAAWTQHHSLNHMLGVFCGLE